MKPTTRLKLQRMRRHTLKNVPMMPLNALTPPKKLKPQLKPRSLRRTLAEMPPMAKLLTPRRRPSHTALLRPKTIQRLRQQLTPPQLLVSSSALPTKPNLLPRQRRPSPALPRPQPTLPPHSLNPREITPMRRGSLLKAVRPLLTVPRRQPLPGKRRRPNAGPTPRHRVRLPRQLP